MNIVLFTSQGMKELQTNNTLYFFRFEILRVARQILHFLCYLSQKSVNGKIKTITDNFACFFSLLKICTPGCVLLFGKA